jgi:hypothetical protein
MSDSGSQTGAQLLHGRASHTHVSVLLELLGTLEGFALTLLGKRRVLPSGDCSDTMCDHPN